MGNKNSSLMDTGNVHEHYYLGALMGVFDGDTALRIAAKRNTDFDKVLEASQEYQEWWAGLLKSDEDPGFEEMQRKHDEFVKGQFDEEIAGLLENTKQKYSKMFKKMEELFSNASINGQAKKLEIKDGVIDFDGRTFLLHNIPIDSDEEALQSRKDLGLIATEWFGKLEKFSESRFCTSFIKSNSGTNGKPIKHGKSITFVVDTSSPEIRKLLHLDFFEYMRNKSQGKLEKYSQEDLEILGQLEEWSDHDATTDPILKQLNGNGGASRRVAEANPTWAAIPAGIPSKYIVAVRINGLEDKVCKEDDFFFESEAKVKVFKNKEEQEKLAACVGEIFQVPVINPECKVVWQPAPIETEIAEM